MVYLNSAPKISLVTCFMCLVAMVTTNVHPSGQVKSSRSKIIKNLNSSSIFGLETCAICAKSIFWIFCIFDPLGTPVSQVYMVRSSWKLVAHLTKQSRVCVQNFISLAPCLHALLHIDTIYIHTYIHKRTDPV